ncbi:hypothetical protein AB0G54_41840 [Streptomyces yokosukanensis]|uniref:hypothetical protein n=1 Tax=Streptomyces yokosukanensis TaxID=67386 RepID=UPI000AA00F6F
MDLFESADAQGAFAAVKKSAETGGDIVQPPFVSGQRVAAAPSSPPTCAPTEP